jgi:hypothetical protein
MDTPYLLMQKPLQVHLQKGDNIAVWKDLSGNGHDALSTEGTPVWQPFGFNELPTLFFDYNTQMTVQNSSEEFDGWTKLSVYAVLEEKSIMYGAFGLVKVVDSMIHPIVPGIS